MYDTLRFWTDVDRGLPRRVFRDPIVIKAHCRGSGIIGTALGPFSPGTAYVLLHHYMGEVDGSVGAWGFARGGMGAVTKALAASFQAPGGEIIARAPASSAIMVRSGKARRRGARQRRGDTARDDRRLECRSQAHLPEAVRREAICRRTFVKRARNFKIRGSSGKLNIALDGLPEFPALGAGQSAASRRHALHRLARADGARL